MPDTQNIYYIWDNVAEGRVGALVVSPHDAPVKRLFFDLLGDPEQPMSKHAADYSLVRAGQISHDGYIAGHDEIVTIADGSEYLNLKAKANGSES